MGLSQLLGLEKKKDKQTIGGARVSARVCMIADLPHPAGPNNHVILVPE